MTNLYTARELHTTVLGKKTVSVSQYLTGFLTTYTLAPERIERICKSEQFPKYLKDGIAIPEEEDEEIIQSIKRSTHLLSDKVDGETVLHLALRLDKLPIANELTDQILQHLPNVCQHLVCNSQDLKGRTPAHWACLSKKDSKPILKKLHDYGADFSIVDSDGNSLLHYACARSDEASKQIACILLGDSVSVETRNRMGETPLHVACRCNSNAMPTLLEVNDANWDDFDTCGDTPLHKACRNGHFHIDNFRLLCKTHSVHAANNGGNTPLHLAAQLGDYRYVEALLACGADPTLLNGDDQIPLHCACLSLTPNKRIVKLLLEAYPKGIESRGKPAVGQTDSVIQTPLQMACANNNCSINLVEELFQHQSVPNVNEQDSLGRRPIYFVCKNDKSDCDTLLLLLKNGSEVFDPNKLPDDEAKRTSAAEVVCDSQVIDKIELLIHFLFDPNVASKGWSRPATRVFPGFPEPRLLDQFIKALYELHEATKQQAASGNPTLPFAKILTAAILASEIGCSEFLTKCITDENVIVNWLDNEAEILREVLNVSIQHGHESIMSALVECLPASAWTTSLKILAGKGARLLISQFPILAAKAFDRCVHRNNEREYFLTFDLLETTKVSANDLPVATDTPPNKATKVNQEITDYEKPLLSEPDDSKQQSKQLSDLQESSDPFDNHPILLMIKSDKSRKEKLLDHPLVRVFVLSMWCQYGRPLNQALFLCFYTTFLILLTGVFLFQAFPRFDGMDIGPVLQIITSGFAVLLMILSVANIAKKAIEMGQQRKMYRRIENVLEIVLYMLALTFAILYLIPDSHRPAYLNSFQRRLSGFTVFCGWINLTLFLRTTPIGITVIAFKNVSFTYVKHFPLILIFTFAFSALFFSFLHSSLFFRYFKPLLKVAVIIVGQYQTLDKLMEIDNITEKAEHKLHFVDAAFGSLIFIIFVCVMTVVMMNMLVGIAVDEISKVLKEAERNALAMKAEWFIGVRRFMQKRPTCLEPLLNWFVGPTLANSEAIKIHKIGVKQLVENRNCFIKWLYNDLIEAEEQAKSIWDICRSMKPQDTLMTNLQSELSATRSMVVSLPREIDNNIKATVDAAQKSLLQKLQKQQLLQYMQLQQQLLELQKQLFHPQQRSRSSKSC